MIWEIAPTLKLAQAIIHFSTKEKKIDSVKYTCWYK